MFRFLQLFIIHLSIYLFYADPTSIAIFITERVILYKYVYLFIIIIMITVINTSAAVTLLEQRPEKICSVCRLTKRYA